MPHSTMSLKTTRVRPKKKDGDGSLEDVEGLPFHVQIHNFANSEKGRIIVDTETNRYFRVENVIPRNRAVTIVGEAGFFGEAGNTYEVDSGRLTHTKGDMEASTARVRVTLFVPPFSTIAIFAIEARRGVPTGSLFINSFLSQARERFDSLFFPTETVMEHDAWAAAGDLVEIQVRRPNRQMNLSSGIDPSRADEHVEGNLSITATPPKGTRHWPRKVWERIQTRDLDAAVFIGTRNLNGPVDPDENILVTIERDNRKKTFELGSDGKPAVREVLTTRQEAVLTDTEFFDRAASTAGRIYSDLELGWEAAWFDGDWPEAWNRSSWKSE